LQLTKLSDQQIRSLHPIEEIEAAITEILTTEGLEAIHEFITEKELSERGHLVRRALIQQMYLAQAWTEVSATPHAVQEIMTHCALLDDLGTQGSMKGRYLRASPFLAALFMNTEYPVWDILQGRLDPIMLTVEDTEDGALLSLPASGYMQ